ncbi:unnamed protein product [Rhodiola kirilowii]
MSHKSIDKCTFKLHSWKPFHIPTKTLDSSDSLNPKPSSAGFHSKRPCLSDRATSFAIDSLDMSNLTLFDDDRPISAAMHRRGSLRMLAGKRRRRGSRSLSGRSSDRSANRRCCSVGASAAYATCSDFPVPAGTDSSGELFVNGGEANWASDVSEARSSSRKEKDDREHATSGIAQFVGLEGQGNESGYGSEPGYRGDAELGYGDEFDEEEDDQRPLFWGNKFEVVPGNKVMKLLAILFKKMKLLASNGNECLGRIWKHAGVEVAGEAVAGFLAEEHEFDGRLASSYGWGGLPLARRRASCDVALEGGWLNGRTSGGGVGHGVAGGWKVGPVFDRGFVYSFSVFYVNGLGRMDAARMLSRVFRSFYSCE